MELIWIPITIFAALMQAVRTAGQKTLNRTMTTMGTTWARSVAGLPVLIVYLAIVLVLTGGGWPVLSGHYLFFCTAGALAQILATALLIVMLRLRNFAVGTMLVKSDIVMTALIGSVFFSEQLSGPGWLALFVVLAGVLSMLLGRLDPFKIVADGLSGSVSGRVICAALSCALMFAFSFLFLREAVLEMGMKNALWRAAWTVVIVNALQSAGLGLWIHFRERQTFEQLRPNWHVIGFIGLTSALGSIGWFTAFALQNASYVRAVGQIEVVFALLLSWLWFREKITAMELTGIILTLVGVVMFRLV